MRKFSSIFFLFVFLLYHAGYLGVYWLATKQIDQYWSSKLTYEGHIKRIAIPMSLPYWGGHEDYRPADGMFELDGKMYRKVLRKYARDTVHLVIVEDNLTTQLHKSIREWIQLSTESNSDENSKTTLLKASAKDYVTYDSLIELTIPNTATTQHNTLYYTDKSVGKSDVSSPPPKC